MKLLDLANAVDGKVDGENVDFSRFCTDTREITKGDIFVALQGDNFDGHDFVNAAFEKGAVAAMVNSSVSSAHESTQSQNNFTGGSLLYVEDTTLAFGAAASFQASQFPAKKVAVTGSCGKTTVKEMLASIFAQEGKVLATQGNFNNEIGVPKTLLNITAEHEFAVIEMGANHFGEIAYLSGLVKAQVVAITNADRAHLEGFGSVEGVSKAKGEIFSGAEKGGIAVLNLDDKHFDYWQQRAEEAGLEVMAISLAKDSRSKVYLEKADQVEDGYQLRLSVYGQSLSCFLPMLGMHNVVNALMATAITVSLGLSHDDIARGLKNTVSARGRLNTHHINENFCLIDDTYNANPLSAKAAIDALASLAGEKILVMGDMGELGADEESFHRELGAYALEKGVDRLLTVGNLAGLMFDSFSGEGKAFAERREAWEYLENLLPIDKLTEGKKISVLVKGSRYTQMDLLVKHFVGADT